jgi:hypothetical protein
MNVSKTALLIAISLAAIAFTLRESRSQPGDTGVATPGGKWPDVQVVTYASGLTGFFDRSNGRLYVYAADIRSPYTIVEIQELGQPLKVLRAAPNP